jgi:hypothetical protein
MHIVAQGGGVLAATVRLAPALAVPAQSDLVDGVTNRVVPGGTSLPAGTAAARAAAVLAAALTGRPGTGAAGPPLDSSQALSVLQAYTEAKLLTLPGPAGPAGAPAFTPAGTVLLVLPAAGASDKGTQAFDTALAGDLTQRGADTVLAAPTGSLPAALISPPMPRISTVDGIETPQGQLIAVLTLAAAGHGHPGNYGASTGAIPPMPSAAPVSQH